MAHFSLCSLSPPQLRDRRTQRSRRSCGGHVVIAATEAERARVVSVNVGMPRDVLWQGKSVRTSIWKTPITGRVWAGRLCLAGDAQADLKGHGGEMRAIMVYQTEAYAFWANELDRDDLSPGHF